MKSKVMQDLIKLYARNEAQLRSDAKSLAESAKKMRIIKDDRNSEFKLTEGDAIQSVE